MPAGLNGIANGVIRHCCVNPFDLEGTRANDVQVTTRVGRFDLSLMVRWRPSFATTSVEVNREKAAGFLWGAKMKRAIEAGQATDRPRVPLAQERT